jgi:hypothetical protein
MRTFEPQRFHGAMSLFVAMVSEVKPPIEIWKSHVTGEIRIHPVNCAHDNMMDPIPSEKICLVLANELSKQPATIQTPSQRRTSDDQSV